MDVEGAIGHPLEFYARAEARMAKAEARMDRQIVAIQKLVKTGMKLIVRIEAKQAEMQKAQARTDGKIDRLADLWLKRPPNSHGKR